jgi:hypothetical protein
MVCFDFEGAPINAWVRVPWRDSLEGISRADQSPSNFDELKQVEFMMSTDDIYSRKKAFLEGQVRRITTTLGASREYKAATASATVEDGDRLSETIVDNAIYKCISLAFKS